MSAEQFSKLSLQENMVTTRAGAARASRPRATSQVHEQDKPLPSIEPVSPVSPTPSLVVSTNNLRYNVSAFDSNLRRRAKRGLEDNDIRLKYCATTVDEDNPDIKTQYFYIDDDITVAMGGKLRRPRCSCGANDNGLACKHIYWVGDHIMSTDSDRLEGQPLQLSIDGSTIQDVKPADILNRQGLEDIADDLDWVYRDQELPEDEEDMKDAVINMLSVFEPQEALPSELRCPESPLTSERSKKYQKFTDMFTQYASRDPGLFLQMRDIIDPNFQSRVFFEKIDNRITRTFIALDEYITHGPTEASVNALRYDVPNCAKKLKALVKAIDDFHQELAEDDPDARDIAVRAAAALVRILDRVVDRNVNAYEDITWGMRPSNPIENNLFIALIQTRRDDEPLFVLEALQALPFEDVLRNHWETLQSVGQKLVEYKAPAAYTNTFRGIVHDSRKRAASQARGGEFKRSA